MKNGGRPVMTSGKKTKKIDARFTEEEYRLIEELEKTLGIRKTDLVRDRLLNDARLSIINAKELIALLGSIGTELGRCGNNINQLAKYANILLKNDSLSPVVMERFNMLFANYIIHQKELEVSLRRVIRALR